VSNTKTAMKSIVEVAVLYSMVFMIVNKLLDSPARHDVWFRLRYL